MSELYQVTCEEDKFFNPNICHVCKITDNGKFLICDQCHMISYCSENHRLIHEEYHVQICAVMQKLLESHPQFWLTFDLNLEEWVELRKELVCLTKLELQRDLKPYELQMITLTKSCFICHQQANLNTCMKCYSVNYCPGHVNHLKSHYSSNCKELLLCLWVNIERISHIEKMKKFILFPNRKKPVVNMDTFIKEFVYSKWDVNDIFDGNVPSYIYSNYASGPLSLYYGMQEIDILNLHVRNSYLVIHIIAANSVDTEYLPAWELLLHLLPNIKVLEIILIGPALRTACGRVKICRKRCKSLKLSFESHCMLYHNYVSSKQQYKRPDIIIGFQVDLSDWEKLVETILEIENQDCPLFLTAKSKLQAEQNVNKIEKVLDSSICNLHLVYNSQNKFSSYMPYHDFENAGVSYRNKYLTVYRKLCNNMNYNIRGLL